MADDTSNCITPDDPNYILHLHFCVEDEPKYSQVLGDKLAAGNVNDEILKEFVMSSSEKYFSEKDITFGIKQVRNKFEKEKRKLWTTLKSYVDYRRINDENAGMRTWFLKSTLSRKFRKHYESCSTEFKKKVDELLQVDKLLKSFVFFQDPRTRSTILKEYSKFVANATKTLGIVELGLIAIAFSKKIRVLEQNDDGDYTHEFNGQDLNLHRTNQNRGGGSGETDFEKDHQPAVSMFKHAIHPSVRKLDRKDHLPTLEIPKRHHHETRNWKGRARNFDPTTIQGMYNMRQKALMEKGDYKEAIWHAMNVNWLSWIKDLDQQQEPILKTFY